MNEWGLENNIISTKEGAHTGNTGQRQAEAQDPNNGGVRIIIQCDDACGENY
jgi:hypothetical protein